MCSQKTGSQRKLVNPALQKIMRIIKHVKIIVATTTVSNITSVLVLYQLYNFLNSSLKFLKSVANQLMLVTLNSGLLKPKISYVALSKAKKYNKQERYEKLNSTCRIIHNKIASFEITKISQRRTASSLQIQSTDVQTKNRFELRTERSICTLARTGLVFIFHHPPPPPLPSMWAGGTGRCKPVFSP